MPTKRETRRQEGAAAWRDRRGWLKSLAGNRRSPTADKKQGVPQIRSTSQRVQIPPAPFNQKRNKMAAEHTKLPWKVSKASLDGKELFVRGDDVTIVACRHRLPYPLSNANMEFIVRACNSHDALLEACKAAVEATGGSENWNGETEKFLKLCEAAITLAEPKEKP